MTGSQKWNLIVKEYKQLYNEPEIKVQSAWETYCAELFEYKRLLGEIVAQPHISVGSGGSLIPDILLKIDGRVICDIELKRYCLPFEDSFENQLISYFNQTHLSIGMIVCNKIYLYHYEYATQTVSSIEIPFEENNEDGINLMEMLSKYNFSEEQIQNYISSKLSHEKSKQEIKSILNDTWIRDTIKSKLLDKYSETDVNEVLSEYTFKAILSQKNASTLSVPASITHISTNTLTKEELSSIILEWCQKKINEGVLIPFRSAFHGNRYTRFTTSDMDEFIEYEDTAKSGWNNGHFYAYEIDCSHDKIKMYIVLSNKNAPEHIRACFAKIFAITRDIPKKANWEWKFIFSTKPFPYNALTTREEIYQALDSRFSQIRANISTLIKNL